MPRRSAPAVAALAVLTALAHAGATGQDPVAAAKEAYLNAEYERCVAVLESATIPAEQFVAAREYRAWCLMALDREADAARAVEDILRVQPLYKVPAGASPRLTALVTRVKRSVLPGIVQERYAAAKKAYDSHTNTEAADGFRTVIALLEDPALDGDTAASLGGLKTVASGFLDLMAAAPQPAPVKPPPPVAPQPGVKQPPRIYSGADQDISPPEIINQTLPAWVPDSNLARAGILLRGTVEVIISESGAVESARLIGRIHPNYDTRLVRAARGWTYRPARQKDGTPVKYRKLIEITLKPS